MSNRVESEEAFSAPRDFFISYTSVDRPWAEWIGWHLEAAGYQVVIQAWDFRPGQSFVELMDQATRQAARTIAVLSPDYFQSRFTPAEWQAAFRRDPTGIHGLLLPVRVRDCAVDGLLGSIGYIDLVDLAEQDARERLLAGVRQERAKPAHPPAFPGIPAIPSSAGPVPAFPGAQITRPWNIPYPRNPFFGAREDELRTLHACFQQNHTAAISGLGGVGKTQLAVEYAYRHRTDYNAVLWVNAASLETLNASYSELATLLALPQREAREQERIVQAVRHWLETQPGYLLILDTLDEPELLFPADNTGQSVTRSPFLPPTPAGQLLVTTRAADLSNLGLPITHPLSLEVFSPEQGASLLLTRAGLLDQAVSLEQTEQEMRELAIQIARELGGLALALDQAGAYLAATGESLVGYLALVQQHLPALLRQHRGRNYPHAVATTWNLSFARVAAQNPAAADLLRFCAFLAPDAIPEEILTQSAEHLGETLAPVVTDPLAYNETIEALRTYSLLTRDARSRTLSVHRLVQAVLRESLTVEQQQVWKQRVIAALNAAFPDPAFAHWPACERLLPHAQFCTAWIEQDAALATPTAARLLNQAGVYLHARGRYAEAEPLLQRALAIHEQQFGREHPATATSLNNLADLYRSEGKYEQAEPLLQRALAICERVLGSRHPTTATSLNNLAALYDTQGRYTEAEPLYERALAIREQMLGPRHPDTSTSLHNLAALYDTQGRYKQAEALLQRALAIDEQTLGREHPDTAGSLNSLAGLYRNQGKYEQAEALYQRVLTIREQVLGLRHPDTAQSLNNLAVLYTNQGKYEQAEPLLQRALTIHEQVLGREHPDTAGSLNNLAELYRSQSKYEQAESLLRRALAICEQALGLQHPTTAQSLNNLAGLYWRQGRYAEAEPLSERALSIREQASGKQHPDTASSLDNLAMLYTDQGKYEQAEPLLRRALAIREQTLGQEHPDTAHSLNNLAHLYTQQKRDTEAKTLYERALAICERVLGTAHSTTQAVRANYTALLQEMEEEN